MADREVHSPPGRVGDERQGDPPPLPSTADDGISPPPCSPRPTVMSTLHPYCPRRDAKSVLHRGDPVASVNPALSRWRCLPLPRRSGDLPTAALIRERAWDVLAGAAFHGRAGWFGED